LDTIECNAHTIAADVLWTGTPIITWARHETKMCSRVAASIAKATGYGDQMVANSMEDYEARAIRLAESVRYEVKRKEGSHVVERRGRGELMDLHRSLFLDREKMPLFDTRRWTQNFEKGLAEAWRRYIAGTCIEDSDEWQECEGEEKKSGSIWVQDDRDGPGGGGV